MRRWDSLADAYIEEYKATGSGRLLPMRSTAASARSMLPGSGVPDYAMIGSFF